MKCVICNLPITGNEEEYYRIRNIDEKTFHLDCKIKKSEEVKCVCSCGKSHKGLTPEQIEEFDQFLVDFIEGQSQSHVSTSVIEKDDLTNSPEVGDKDGNPYSVCEICSSCNCPEEYPCEHCADCSGTPEYFIPKEHIQNHMIANTPLWLREHFKKEGITNLVVNSNKLVEVTEELYNLNRLISISVMKKEILGYETVIKLNRELGKVIKKLRGLTE